MKSNHKLPDGWTSAVKYFSRLSKEELDQHGLPAASKDRKSLLRYLHTNGTGFVYCRGTLGIRYVAARTDSDGAHRCCGVTEAVELQYNIVLRTLAN